MKVLQIHTLNKLEGVRERQGEIVCVEREREREK